MKREDIIALGYTTEYITHIETQIPDLIEESVKRIKFMPFDVNTAFIAIKPNGKASIVLRHLCKQSKLAILEATAPEGQQLAIIHSLHTEINGTRRDKDHTKLINIRGHLKTIDKMPLYLEEGAYGRQYVYPIFDWSELQTMVASMMIVEEFQKKCEASMKLPDLVSDNLQPSLEECLSAEDKKELTDMRAREDTEFITAVIKIAGEQE